MVDHDGRPSTGPLAPALAAAGVSTVAGLAASPVSIADDMRPAFAYACACIPGAWFEAVQALPADDLVAAGPSDYRSWALGNMPMPGYAVHENCEQFISLKVLA